MTYHEPVGTGLPKHIIEDVAGQVAQHLGFKPGDSLEELVTKTGGKLVFGHSGDEDHESGSIIARSQNDYVIYLSPNTSRLRDRFTIAHELGHLILHLPQIKAQDSNAVMRATRWIDESNEGQKRAEWEANWFAAAMLMPKEKFSEVYNKDGISGVQVTFDVSSAAAQTRAKSLGLAN